MQHWSESNPCAYCGATSNTGHISTCQNAGLYDSDGHPIAVRPYHREPDRSFTDREINNRFGFHRATLEGPNATSTRHKELRAVFKEFATYLDVILPEGRFKSVAFTELESASMWAHKAIAQDAPLIEE